MPKATKAAGRCARCRQAGDQNLQRDLAEVPSQQQEVRQAFRQALCWPAQSQLQGQLLGVALVPGLAPLPALVSRVAFPEKGHTEELLRGHLAPGGTDFEPAVGS